MSSPLSKLSKFRSILVFSWNHIKIIPLFVVQIKRSPLFRSECRNSESSEITIAVLLQPNGQWNSSSESEHNHIIQAEDVVLWLTRCAGTERSESDKCFLLVSNPIPLSIKDHWTIYMELGRCPWRLMNRFQGASQPTSPEQRPMTEFPSLWWWWPPARGVNFETTISLSVLIDSIRQLYSDKTFPFNECDFINSAPCSSSALAGERREDPQESWVSGCHNGH